MLVLEGPQGSGKSSGIRKLCPADEYFTDSLSIGADKKEIVEITAGKWLVELPELDGMGKRDAATIKAMMSRQSDKTRLSYARMPTERPRQFLMFGTVNDEHYLHDMTGNRRFWPVRTGLIDLQAIERDRDMIWAEAAYYETQGEPSTLPRELWAAAAEEQQDRMIPDRWHEILAEHLEERTGVISSDEIYATLNISTEKSNPSVSRRVSGILKSLGYQKTRRRDGGQRGYGYERK
jgi:predicted P-loop ATPase